MQSLWSDVRMLVIVSLIGLLTACGDSTTENPVLELEQTYHRMASGEGTREQIDSTRRALIDAYVLYVDEYPADSLAVEYLDRAAMLHAAEPSESLKAISLFERIMQEFPESVKAPEALFMKAYVLSNSLQDYDEAKTHYQQFLDNYPDHGLASDARNELEMMGMPIEDIFDSLPIDSINGGE